MIITGKTNQNNNKAKQIKSQKNRPRDRTATWNKRIKKLIILPCQSYCPNMGTKIFCSHKLGAKNSLPCLKYSKHFLKTCLEPPPYHQNGKYNKSTKASSISFCKIKIYIKLVFNQLLSLITLYQKIKTSPIGEVTKFVLSFSD